MLARDPFFVKLQLDGADTLMLCALQIQTREAVRLALQGCNDRISQPEPAVAKLETVSLASASLISSVFSQ